MMNRLTASLVWLGLVGCSSQVPLDNSPCPCPESLGYMCCGSGSARSCIRPEAGQICNPDPIVDSGPVPDSSVDSGAPEVRTVDSPFVSIGIGRAHACATRQDLSITCIGDNSKGQATPPRGQFRNVIAGADLTCGTMVDPSDISSYGINVCWGDNTYGQASPPAGFGVSVIGSRHACGYDQNGNLACWGDDSLGQTDAPAGKIYGLTAGHNHTCGIKQDPNNLAYGSVICWGDDSLGQTDAPAGTLPGTLITEIIRAGGDHTCVTGFGSQLTCWGDKTAGQSSPPYGIAFPYSFALAPGHACGVAIDHKIVCWGSDWGDATPIPPNGTFDTVVGGDYRMCAWTNDGSLNAPICWGSTYEPWY